MMDLAQALVLSKLYYNDIVYHSLPDYLMKRLQRVPKATASFVLGRFVSSEDILTKLKWLPVKEQREWNQDYIKFCKDTKNIIFKRALEHLA